MASKEFLLWAVCLPCGLAIAILAIAWNINNHTEYAAYRKFYPHAPAMEMKEFIQLRNIGMLPRDKAADSAAEKQ